MKASSSLSDISSSPSSGDKFQLDWTVIGFFTTLHLLALGALVPQFFSWSGVLVALVGTYLFGCLGINICYHRLLTHRSFKCPVWFEKILTCLAFCNVEMSSVRWVGTHRMHHQYSDREDDPHTPREGFFWAHMGWMMTKSPALDGGKANQYAGDLASDGFHGWMDKKSRWIYVWFAHVILITLGGFFWGYHTSGALGSEAWIMAGSWFFWGVSLRTVFMWHVTWSVNSLTHMFGYRNYDTGEDSRNNPLVSLLSFGEGLHNNHHADPDSATNWHRWWELDVSYITIKLFELVGLASNVKTPARRAGGPLDISRKT